MNPIIKGEYMGELRTANTLLKSGESLVTDGPVEKNGKGEAFSPTDLVATALADCIMTIMAIKADQKGWDLSETRYEIDIEMANTPRRISQITVDFYFPKVALPPNGRKILEACAGSCPVSSSLHPDLKQNIRFHWEE